MREPARSWNPVLRVREYWRYLHIMMVELCNYVAFNMNLIRLTRLLLFIGDH